MTCYSCLREFSGNGYCRKCLKSLFGGARVQHILPYDAPSKDTSELYLKSVRRHSISGVQEKYMLRLEGSNLTVSPGGGHYILKPIPSSRFPHPDQVPANEHLTMQVASQVFRIPAAVNGIILFKDQTPAYIARRFDIRSSTNEHLEKFAQEDFAQIAGISEETHGKNYKYDLSYEEIGMLIRKYIPMFAFEIEKFFRLLIFNYIFCNGDAHAKNFSVIRTDDGDHVLTPAYDLLCTKIHSPSESDMALSFFKDRFSTSFEAHGFYTRADFLELGAVLGMKETRVQKVLRDFNGHRDRVNQLVQMSFLSPALKNFYTEVYQDRMARLRIV